MGTVWQGLELSSGTEVAIKVLSDSSAENVARFELEATVLATLSHPNIVRYLGYGTTASGEHFLVEDWAPGLTLTKRLRTTGLSINETVLMGTQIAEALAEAHSRGIIHRDIKPSNILLSNNRWLLVDFGVARVFDHGVRLTRTGTVLGTLGFMAPEQARADRDVGPTADVFGLGCVMYICLTGKKPFEGKTPLAVQAKILSADPEPPVLARPEIPQGLSSLVLRMLAKAPSARPRNAQAISIALESIVMPAAANTRFMPTSDQTDDVSTAVVGPRAADKGELSCIVLTGSTTALDNAATVPPKIRELLKPFGGDPALLGDGAMVYSLPSQGNSEGRAKAAARAALSVHHKFPALPVAIAGGYEPGSLGRSLDDAGETLASGTMASIFSDFLSEQAPGYIHIDQATARHLGSEFTVEMQDGKLVLIGERAT